MSLSACRRVPTPAQCLQSFVEGAPLPIDRGSVLGVDILRGLLIASPVRWRMGSKGVLIANDASPPLSLNVPGSASITDPPRVGVPRPCGRPAPEA